MESIAKRYSPLIVAVSLFLFFISYMTCVQASAQNTQPPPATATSSEATEWTAKEWVPVVAASITLVGVIIGFVVNHFNMKKSLSTSGWQTANKAEIEEIDEKLKNLYGRLILILARDHLFAQDLRARQTDPNYRLLPSLFDKDWKESLTEADRAFVEQVCSASKEIDKLITENLSIIDPAIIKYFVVASAHFRILNLAYEGKLGNDPEPFKNYVYPLAFDDVINLEVTRLLKRKESLIKNFSVLNPPMPTLTVPDTKEFKLDWIPDPGSRIGRLLGLNQQS